MLQSRKRHMSMSPTRSQQPQDAPEHKKRKPNAPVSSGTSKAPGGSRPQVARNPAPPVSDSSTTLDGDSPPSKDKGKAVEKDPLILELERLRKEVRHKNELLEKTEKTISAITQTLTCQICLDLIHSPYALAPCGHVSCHRCLVGWFTSSHNDDATGQPGPDVEGFSDDASSLSESDHAPGAGSVQGGNAQENGNLTGAHPHGNAGNFANGTHPPPAPLPDPDMPAYPNSVNRRKTCPHCRCVVRERPVQVYALKDLVDIIDSPPEPVKDDKPKKKVKKGEKAKKEAAQDPWKGIFHETNVLGPLGVANPLGGNDSDGSSTEALHSWPGLGLGFIPNGPAPNEFWADEENSEPLDQSHPVPAFYEDYHPHEAAASQPPPPFIDHEDGVRRCGFCMHEVWRGECTNENCDVVYDDDPGSDADLYGAMYGVREPTRRHLDEENEEEDGVAWESSEPAVEGDEDDGYESSFIDDDEHGAREERRMWGSDEEEKGGGISPVAKGEDFNPGLSPRWSEGRQNVIVVTSDEDEGPGPSRRAGRGRTRRILDEEDEEEQEVEGDVRSVGDENLDEVVDPPHFELDSPSTSDLHSAAPEYDEEDEDASENGYVPYVWEEEDAEDAEDGQDHVLHLHDGDDNDASGDDGYGY